jgi:hypothetical protein
VPEFRVTGWTGAPGNFPPGAAAMDDDIPF